MNIICIFLCALCKNKNLIRSIHIIYFLLKRAAMWKSLKTLVLFALIANVSSDQVLASEPMKEYGIVLLPTSEICMETERLNKEITKTFPNIANQPNNFHITLLQGRFKESNLASLIEAVKATLTDNFICPLAIELEPALSLHGAQNIFWDVKKNSALLNLHGLMVHNVSMLRDASLQRYQDTYLTLAPHHQKQIDQFGVRNVLEHYHPHFTLFYGEKPAKEQIEAQTQNMKQIAQSLVPNKDLLKFTATTVAIGELGYQGNLIKIIEKIELK